MVFDKNGSGYLIREEFMQIIKQGNFMSTGEKKVLYDKANKFYSSNEKMLFSMFLKLLKEG